LNNPHGGLEGLLTKCRFDGIVFYVRENIACPGGHFHVSAGERMGWKQGRLSRRHAQILELAAPEDDWNRIATTVHEVDRLKRPVRKNRRFTFKWAEATLKSRMDYGGTDASFPFTAKEN
jgi:hypothetical protein